MKFSRFRTEFKVVFLKKWYELTQDLANFLFYAIASVVFTIITAIITIIVYNSFNDSSEVLFSWENIRKHGDKFAFFGPGLSSVKDFVESQSQIQGVVYDTIESFEEGLFNNTPTYSNNLDQSNKEDYSFGVAIKLFNPQAAVLTIYFNSSIEETEIDRAELTTCFLDTFSKLYLSNFQNKQDVNSIDFKDTNDNSFHVKYDPLNNGISKANLWMYFGPLLMSFGLTNLASIFANKPVEDRENYRLHMLTTSGLSLFVYWFATFVFDLIIYEITNIFCWIVLFAFRTDALVSNNWMCTFFLFVFEPLHILPLVYAGSLFFDTLLSVSQFFQTFLVIITLIPYFVITLVIGNDIDDTTACIVSIVPPYAIQNGLRIAAERACGKPVTAKDTWSGIFVILFAIQIGCGIIFALLGILVYKIKSGAKSKAKSESRRVSNENKNEVVDEDVTELNDMVLSGQIFDSHDNAIVVKNITKQYNNSVTALSQVNLYVKVGEVFGVLGANGAGKSTLMSVITGRTNPSEGEIYLFDQLMSQSGSSNEIEKYVSICPQFDNHLFPCLTPRQHFILYGMLKYFYTNDETSIDNIDDLTTIISEYEQLMELQQHKDKLVRELSGGNQRKLSIALAFLGNPRIVFLDEPTASLDPVARLQVQSLIETKSHENILINDQNEKRTILLCTHLLSEAEVLCNRLCIMMSGHIKAIGTHQHLSEKYGKTWKVDLGLVTDDDECRQNVDNFMKSHFNGCELCGQRFCAASYNIPTTTCQLSEVFLILNQNKARDFKNNDEQTSGYNYFTCSMSTLERVFVDIIMQAES